MAVVKQTCVGDYLIITTASVIMRGKWFTRVMPEDAVVEYESMRQLRDVATTMLFQTYLRPPPLPVFDDYIAPYIIKTETTTDLQSDGWRTTHDEVVAWVERVLEPDPERRRRVALGRVHSG